MSLATPLVVMRTHLRGSLSMSGGYWGIMIPVYIAIITVVVTVGHTDVSIWATSGGSAPKYFQLALGVMLSTAFLPVYVGNGVTRRDFAFGASLYILVVSTAYAILMTIGFIVEYGIYSSAGIMGGLTDPYPMRSAGGALSIFVGELLVGLTYFCSGWVMGTCFYRFGTWWGLALIPVTLVPAVATEIGFDALWVGYGLNNGLGIEAPPLAVGVLVAAVSIAVAWSVNFALIRTLAIKKVSG